MRQKMGIFPVIFRVYILEPGFFLKETAQASISATDFSSYILSPLQYQHASPFFQHGPAGMPAKLHIEAILFSFFQQFLHLHAGCHQFHGADASCFIRADLRAAHTTDTCVIIGLFRIFHKDRACRALFKTETAAFALSSCLRL